MGFQSQYSLGMRVRTPKLLNFRVTVGQFSSLRHFFGNPEVFAAILKTSLSLGRARSQSRNQKQKVKLASANFRSKLVDVKYTHSVVLLYERFQVFEIYISEQLSMMSLNMAFLLDPNGTWSIQ